MQARLFGGEPAFLFLLILFLFCFYCFYFFVAFLLVFFCIISTSSDC